MEKKIFKEKQLKKTLIESVENPLTGEIIGAVKINNKVVILEGEKYGEG